MQINFEPHECLYIFQVRFFSQSVQIQNFRSSADRLLGPAEVHMTSTFWVHKDLPYGYALQPETPEYHKSPLNITNYL